MKKSIGGTYVLNLIIVFLLIMFGFLMALFSYTKAYKVSKEVTNIIQNNSGYNDYSKKEIENYLKSIGYKIVTVSCPSKNEQKVYNDNGLCIYQFSTYKDGNNKDLYATYGIVSYMTIELPLINLIKIPIYEETDKIYIFK